MFNYCQYIFQFIHSLNSLRCTAVAVERPFQRKSMFQNFINCKIILDVRKLMSIQLSAFMSFNKTF